MRINSVLHLLTTVNLLLLQPVFVIMFISVTMPVGCEIIVLREMYDSNGSTS